MEKFRPSRSSCMKSGPKVISGPEILADVMIVVVSFSVSVFWPLHEVNSVWSRCPLTPEDTQYTSHVSVVAFSRVCFCSTWPSAAVFLLMIYGLQQLEQRRRKEVEPFKKTWQKKKKHLCFEREVKGAKKKKDLWKRVCFFTHIKHEV